MVKKDYGILNRQSLLTAKVYSHGFQKCLIFSYEKVNTLIAYLIGKFVEYKNFQIKVVLHKTIRNDEFWRNTALQLCCDIGLNDCNIVPTL